MQSKKNKTKTKVNFHIVCYFFNLCSVKQYLALTPDNLKLNKSFIIGGYTH